MITIHAKLDCGCCTTEMQFESMSQARRVFEEAGMGNGVKIKDATGTVHEGIDTFYGFSKDEDTQQDKSIGFLAEQLTGPKL